MKGRLDKVLVALKPWQGGLPISAYHARFLSEQLGAKLRLFSCVYEPTVALGVLKGDAGAMAAQVGLMDSERAMLAELGESFSDWGIEAECEVHWGYPAEDVILAEVERWGADMLVVGTHQAGARPHTRLAQVDWQLMRNCPCPMLLARDPKFEGYAHVLAAVDPLHRHDEPTGLDRAILEISATIAKASASELFAANVYPDPQSYALTSAVQVLPGVYYGTENIEAVHREALVELIAEYGIRPSHAVLLCGDPAEALVEYIDAHRVDLAVLGALKRAELEDWLLGSTAEKVVAEVSCDVLLVKHAR